MWNYEKRLQYPLKISQTNPQMAQVIISHLVDLTASLVHLCVICHRDIPCHIKEVTGILTDIGTEELAHMENDRPLFISSPVTLQSNS